jgi:hypothetical protein
MAQYLTSDTFKHSMSPETRSDLIGKEASAEVAIEVIPVFSMQSEMSVRIRGGDFSRFGAEDDECSERRGKWKRCPFHSSHVPLSLEPPKLQSTSSERSLRPVHHQLSCTITGRPSSSTPSTSPASEASRRIRPDPIACALYLETPSEQRIHRQVPTGQSPQSEQKWP